MITSLDSVSFFTAEEQGQLRTLGLLQGSDASAHRFAFATLMLAPIMELCVQDKVTSPTEFQAVEDYIRLIEREFELAPKEEMESVGTDMGMLPMLKGIWKRADFKTARVLLMSALSRLTEDEAHDVRGAIAKASLEVARAGSASLISLHTVNDSDIPLIHEIARDLKLDTTAEGLHLLGKTGEA